MEDSTLLVERTKSKFYETKNKVNSKLGEHLSRSRSLLSEVNRSLNKQKRDGSGHSQRYFVDSFAPFKDNTCREHYRCDSEASRCSTRLASPTFTWKSNSPLGVSETPRHMTQAMWLLNTRNVCCNLSNNVEDDQEKVPEILLKDPADLLRGEKNTREVKSEDKLTELLKEKGKENFESDKVQENHNNSISYDIVSSLDFSKKSVDDNNVYGSDEFINSLLNESYNSLENLTKLLNPKEFKLENANFEGVNSFKNSTKGSSIDMEEMLTEEFVNNSGIDFKKHSEELNSTLLKLNEQDRMRETELAPKVLAKEEKEKNEELEPKKVEFKNVPVTTRETTSGLETDLLGSFTIIKDDKFGRKMYRLSDFDHKFKSSSKDTNSVQVQTEYIEEEKEVKNKKYDTNVRVVYHNAHEGKSEMSKESRGLKKQDLYAQKLVSNLLPRLDMKLEAHPSNREMCKQRDGEQEEARTCFLNPAEENRGGLFPREDASSQVWWNRRQTQANQIQKFKYLGSRVIGGGRKSTFNYLLSSPTRIGERRENDKFSFQKFHFSKNGYSLNKNFNNSSSQNCSLIKSKPVYSNSQLVDFATNPLFSDNYCCTFTKNHISKKHSGADPIGDFDLWWSANTGKLNLLREQLSM